MTPLNLNFSNLLNFKSSMVQKLKNLAEKLFLFTLNEVVQGSFALHILDIDITAGLTQVQVHSVHDHGITV